MAGNGFKWRRNPDVLQEIERRYTYDGDSAKKIAADLGLKVTQVEYAVRHYDFVAGSARSISPAIPPPTPKADGEPKRAPIYFLNPKEPTTQDVEMTAFLSDLHVPSHDPEALRVVLDFIAWLKPATVFLVGDIFDMYQLSRFDQKPSRISKFQEELDKLHGVLSLVRQAAGKDAKVHYMEGNHEARLQKWLCRHPEIASLEDMNPVHLFKLDHFDIEWHPMEETFRHHGVVVTHGTVVRKHAGRSAQGEFEKYMASGISGHVHRLGSYTKTTLDGMYGWYELGCLCELTPEYMIGTADWQQGFCVGTFIRGDNRFSIEQVPIIKHRILYNGLLFD